MCYTTNYHKIILAWYVKKYMLQDIIFPFLDALLGFSYLHIPTAVTTDSLLRLKHLPKFNAGCIWNFLFNLLGWQRGRIFWKCHFRARYSLKYCERIQGEIIWSVLYPLLYGISVLYRVNGHRRPRGKKSKICNSSWSTYFRSFS